MSPEVPDRESGTPTSGRDSEITRIMDREALTPGDLGVEEARFCMFIANLDFSRNEKLKLWMK